LFGGGPVVAEQGPEDVDAASGDDGLGVGAPVFPFFEVVVPVGPGLVNQLHALPREMLAGGAPRDLSASTATALLRRIRPAGDVEAVRKQIASGLVAQIRSLDALLTLNAAQDGVLHVQAIDEDPRERPGSPFCAPMRLVKRLR
jgi:hypothetical protein